MFFHNFKYAFKTLFKNKTLVFWTFAFPLILGTFFYLAFSNIENSEKLNLIDIAVVSNEQFNHNSTFKETIKVLSDDKNKDQIFHTKYVSLKEAKDLLTDGKITGYLLYRDTPTVVVSANGMNETIFKYVIEEVTQTEAVYKNVMMNEIEKVKDPSMIKNPSAFYAELYQKISTMQKNENASIKDVSSDNLSYTMIEFYTLIAMTCLYGGLLGMVAINQCLANMSSTGKRVSVGPTSKKTMIFSSALASYCVQLIGIILLFVYTAFVLQVDYGSHFLYLILLTLVGLLAGLSLGIMIATVFRVDHNTKLGILVSVTMLGCFLSGMMGITMKYIVDTNLPLVNQLNPASMITDGFYSLYYYDTFERFFFNIVSLVLFAILMIVISTFYLRRQKYDSI